MKTKNRLYYILAAVALVAIILTLVLLCRQGREVLPEESAAPVVETSAPDIKSETPEPTATPEPTEIPPAITPPADQAASGTDIILRPVTAATDGDVYFPSPGETVGAQ